jgi:uncharacterized protein YukE
MKFNVSTHIVGKTYDLSQDNMNSMIKTIERLREALEWYGDELNHNTYSYTDTREQTPCHVHHHGKVSLDGGEKARLALEKE